MIIRCPECDHTRSISESRIPPTSELATCPKCKHRFRFRTLLPLSEEAPKDSRHRREGPPPAGHGKAPGQEVLRPQTAFRETAERKDIWDAVGELNQHWRTQIDQHVTEVKTPQPSARQEQADEAMAVLHKGVPGQKLPHELPQTPEQPAEAAPGAEETYGGWARAKQPLASDPDPLPMAEAGPSAMPEKTNPPAFLYANGGPAPEVRVEHDMRMLRAESGSRPTRDLGRLRELDVNAGQAPPAGADDVPPIRKSDALFPETSDEAVPWEQPARIGWIRAFSDTVRGAMFGGPGFFAAMRPGGSLAPAYLFFLLLGYISIVSSLLWSRAFEALLPDMSPFSAERVGLPVLLLLAPMSLGLMQLFVTGWVRLIIGLASPSRADFVLVFRVVGYAFAPFVLSVAPFIGPPLGSAWFLALLIMGCRGALGLSPLLAVLAPLPPALLMLGAITWFFL